MNEGSGLPSLELVGGGLAEWPAGQGPRGETIAPAVFIDADGHELILSLPAHFHHTGVEQWHCSSYWEPEPLALVVQVSSPIEVAFRVPLDPRRHLTIIDAVLRDGACYISPTSPRLGISARMMLDHSFYCPIDRSFAEAWRQQRARP